MNDLWVMHSSEFILKISVAYLGMQNKPQGAQAGASSGTGGPALAQSDKPVSHQSEPSLSAIMQQMTQIMASFQESSVSESSRPPAFKTLSMKAP
ncbi:hypothetical protein O181_028790 [Austropuccinia psidii MF-1]|uniref:Uncharacterized protein n=1 Tax=Austropuccinia psidii MF-1 TaxID=1389203 RepID=A0A9Q3CTE5_9BASI|nr:hypothetical protein [Austropuccinia psidii MF-1]